MRRPRPGVGSELLPVALILIGLAGTLGLVVTMHRKATATRSAARTPAPPAVAAVAPPPKGPTEPEAPQTPPPVAVQPPPEDPTPPALARLSAQEAEQRAAAREADLKAEALATARRAALAESQKWRRREAVVRGQVDRLDDKARALELEDDSLAMERDALATERDAAKAAVLKAKARNGGYAVMPNKSANGTWQRPVMIECRDGQAVLQPQGLSFSMLDLSGVLSARSSPLVLAVGRELIRAHRATSPDGSEVVPYIYFVIRPDGIRPYYEARSRLEPLGIAFGYELVEQDWDVEFPDFDDLATWDDSSAPRYKHAQPGGGGGGGGGGRPGGYAGTGGGPGQVAGGYGFVWPTDRPGSGRGGDGRGGSQVVPGSVDPRRPSGVAPGGDDAKGPGGSGRVADANGFVWPADRPGGARGGNGLWPTRAAGDGQGSSVDLAGDEGPGTGTGNEPGRSATGAGSGVSGTVSALDGLDRDSPARQGSGTGGGLDLPRLPGQSPSGGPRPPATVALGSGRGPGAADGPRPGLVRLNPDGLPGLDSTDPPVSPNGPSGTPLPGSPPPGGVPAGVTGFDPSGLAGSVRPPGQRIPMPGEGSATGSGRLSDGKPPGGSRPGRTGQPASARNVSPPPGWVRIDPAELARDAVGDAADPDRPPAQPSNAKPGGGSGAPAGNPSPSGSASPAGPGGSPPPPGQAGPGIPTFGMNGQPGQAGDYRPQPKAGVAWSPKMNQTISVPLDLVVACGPNGVVIHPGGYRLSRPALRKDGALRRDLETIVRNHEMIDASVRPRPRVQFLVEPGGGETYREARRQTVLDGLPWPVSIQVAGAQAASVFPKERF